MRRQAQEPIGQVRASDMLEFDLNRSYDVVTCLFSAIGILKTFDRLEMAIRCMARHVKPGGLLIIEPWYTPDGRHSVPPFILTGETGSGKVYRLSHRVRKGQLSVLLNHYLRATPTDFEQYHERIELGLFTRDEMTWALEFAGMAVDYDCEGLMGRGLYLGRPDSRFRSSVVNREQLSTKQGRGGE